MMATWILGGHWEGGRTLGTSDGYVGVAIGWVTMMGMAFLMAVSFQGWGCFHGYVVRLSWVCGGCSGLLDGCNFCVFCDDG